MQKRPFAGRRLRESKTAIQNPLFPDERRFVRPEDGTGWAEHRLDPASVVASGLSHAQAAMQPDWNIHMTPTLLLTGFYEFREYQKHQSSNLNFKFDKVEKQFWPVNQLKLTINQSILSINRWKPEEKMFLPPINEIIEGVKGLLVSFHGQGLLIYHKNLLIKSS
jgi:hypothetical protein